ncbi:MAG: FAD-dependent oxidoreductase, partial [Proteobacteria bacterium]|nr:FAD-dependent oxidoreductase [Pseudomonadota bacterium]
MNIPFSRREFIKLAGAGAASAALQGCASAPQAQKPVARVIVVGGGYGGATAARYIRAWGGGAIEVFLVERNTQFVSCPLSNLVLGGSRRIEDLTMGYGRLRDEGVVVLHDEVKSIDPGKKKISLGKIADLTYDRLVVSPGIDFMHDQIAGYDAEAQKTVLHAWKAGPETVALRKQLEAMKDGGVFLLSIPKAPYRCPPGPYERISQVAFYLKHAKPRSKILVLDANEDIVSKKGLFLAAWNDLYKGLIQYMPNHEVKEVAAQAHSVKTDFDTFKADVLNVIPPQRAGNIAAQAGLITTNNRWCDVNWLTTESKAVPGIHVLGDATLSAAAMPKSASMANNHAKIAAGAIVAQLLGQPVNPQPVIANTCYSYVSDSEAMHVTSVHRYDLEKKTLLPVAGAGGLSAKRSDLEKGYADAWARNIWA